MAGPSVIVTCPQCEQTSTATIPEDRCVFFYECPACHTMLKPKRGDCCVFCSYGDRRCPSVECRSASPDVAVIESRTAPSAPTRVSQSDVKGWSTQVSASDLHCA